MRTLRFGCFRVLTDLKSGVGSQGTVYKAVCERDGFEGVAVGTVVALKVMPVQDDDRRQFARLKTRTDELVGLAHPGVVKYLGCFSESGSFSDVHVLVLEWLEGESLKDRLLRNPHGIDADEALRIGEKTLAALVYISSRGMVHRDIKPGNIFLCRDGGVKLIDFEVARPSGRGMTNASTSIIGTFDYMAPDFTNQNFSGDERSDVFSLGVCLHEMLTGRTPYCRPSCEDSRANFAYLSRWNQTEEGDDPVRISPLINRILSGAVEVLAGALRVNRTERYATFSDFALAFRGIRHRELTHGDTTWRLLLYVGHGGFGEVFKARDIESGQVVAIKHLLKNEYAERFRREARVMSRLDGTYFARLISFFVEDIDGVESAFLVMEYLDGMPGLSLRDELKRAGGKPLPRSMVIQAFARYAHGLAILHAKGLVHRDIKPSNLYFPTNAIEQAAIMDFGVARDTGGTETVGCVPGTLDYMPPEIAVEGSRGDAGMDLFALGLCLYEALSGKTVYPRLPAGEVGFLAFFERAQRKDLPHLDASAYSDIPELVLLVVEMVEPDAHLRLKDAADVERRLLDVQASLLGEETQVTRIPDKCLTKRPADRRKTPWRWSSARVIIALSVATLVMVCVGLAVMLSKNRAVRAEPPRSVEHGPEIKDSAMPVPVEPTVTNTLQKNDEPQSAAVNIDEPNTNRIDEIASLGETIDPEAERRMLEEVRTNAVSKIEATAGRRPWGETVSNAVERVRQCLGVSKSPDEIDKVLLDGLGQVAMAREKDVEIAARKAAIEKERIRSLKNDGLAAVARAAGAKPWAAVVSNAVELARLMIESANSAEEVRTKSRSGVETVTMMKRTADVIMERKTKVNSATRARQDFSSTEKRRETEGRRESREPFKPNFRIGPDDSDREWDKKIRKYDKLWKRRPGW